MRRCRVDDLLLRTLIAAEPSVAAAGRQVGTAGGRASCFELLGFDVLINESLKPWLLEVNLSPSLGADTPLDLKVKSCLLADYSETRPRHVRDMSETRPDRR